MHKSTLPQLPRLHFLLLPTNISTINHHQILGYSWENDRGCYHCWDDYEDENTSSDNFPQDISLSMTPSETNLVCLSSFHA